MANSANKKKGGYHSRKILGQIYDQVVRVDFTPAFTAPFDRRILEAYTLQETILDKARELKKGYDARVLRIMAQHEIQTEFEVWSTFVLSHSDLIKDYKFHETIGELSSALKDQYRDLCFKAAEVETLDQIAPFVAAMYAVTAEEMTSALKIQTNQSNNAFRGNNGPANTSSTQMPLISFPWIFHDVLGKIAARDQEKAMKARQDLHRPQEHVTRPPRGARRNEQILTAPPLQKSTSITPALQRSEPFKHSARSMAPMDVVKTSGHNVPTGEEHADIDDEYNDASADEDEAVELTGKHDLHNRLAEFDRDISESDDADEAG